MRWVIRFFLLVVFAFGILLAIVYPWASETMPGYEVGKWRVYDGETGYVPAEAHTAPSETPLWATLDVHSQGPIDSPDGVIVLTMTATAGSRTVLAETFTLQGITPRVLSPQSPERLYTLEPVRIDVVEDSPYIFVVGPGEDDFPIEAIDLTVEAGAIDIDGEVPIVGYAIMGISGLLLLLTFRRRRRNRNEMPPPPKWGRQ